MIDVSLPIHPGMLHGGGQPERTLVESIADGDPGTVSRWLLSAHAGTHVEAPRHTTPGGAAVDELDVELLVGPARVLDLRGVDAEVRGEDLLAAGLDDDERVLLRTRNSTGVLQEREKASAWVGLAPDAAELLVTRGVRLVGVDYLTLETPEREATFDSHRVLTDAGVVIVESVDLSAAEPGPVDLTCLPLTLVGAEAAPARVVLREAGTAPSGSVVDLSVPTHARMLHWGRKPEAIVVESMERGDACDVTRWRIGSHTGTHLDALSHFVLDGEAIEDVGLDVLVGPARVLDCTAATEDLRAQDLLDAGLGDEERVLLKTQNTVRATLGLEDRPDDWIGLAPDAAELLVERGVKLVSIDFLTIDGPTRDETWDTHHVLLPAGVVILECADLTGVDAGVHELTCLPVPLQGSEAAPGRAILRRAA